MKQAEEIEKLQAELAEKEAEITRLESELKKKHGDTLKAVDEAWTKKSKLNAEYQELIERAVEVFSDEPNTYIHHSNSHRINDDISNKIKEIEKNTGCDVFSKATDYIWSGVYHEALRETPKLKKLDGEIEKLRDFLSGGLPKGYVDLQEQITDTKQKASWLRTRISNLSDIGYFRQWAKRQKEVEGRRTRDAEQSKAVEEFKVYFKKEYLPKILKAVEK